MSKIEMSLEAKKLQTKLNQMIKKGLSIDLSNELNLIGGMVVQDIKQRVADGKAMPKGRLKELPQKTIDRKRAEGMPFPEFPLIGTGKMSGALMTQGDGPYIKKHSSPSNKTLTISGANVQAPYGKYHHKKHGNRKARPWFGVSPPAKNKAEKMMVKWINKLTR